MLRKNDIGSAGAYKHVCCRLPCLVKLRFRRFLVVFAAVAFLVVPALCGYADDDRETPEIIPVGYDAVAEVHITAIQHSLRASDARRVEFGAAPPLIPYKAQLIVQRTCPKIRLPRIRLEGIASTSWMPENDSRGILLLTRSGEDYLPAAPFPCRGFLPERDCDGERKIEFPPESGCLAPYPRVWECLCDLQSAQTATLPAARLEGWRKIFRENAPEEALVALFFLLNTPGNTPSIEMLSARLSPAVEGGPVPLPLIPAVQLFAAFLEADTISPVLEMMLKAAPDADTCRNMEGLAGACLDLADRAPETDRIALLETVFTREWEHAGRKMALINTIRSVEPFLATEEDGALDPLLTKMLQEPARFPALRHYDDVALFWRLLDKRSHPGLPGYLRRFMDQPTAEFLGIPLTATAVNDLVGLAEILVADSNAAGSS